MRRTGFRPPEAPSLELMKRLLDRSGIRLSAPQLGLLWRYHSLIRKRNQDRELTRIIEFRSVVEKHFVDCMIVDRFTKLPSPIVDVGTGAGFPGIPLKILRPDLDLILAEPRPKRIAFLKEAIASLGLKKVRVFEHKVVSRSLTVPVRGVITRAVEPIDKSILRTSGALEKGGRLIFMKGPAVDPEIKEAQGRFDGQFRLVEDHHYCLPGTRHERRLVVFERITERIPVSVIMQP